jgi:hypothetical protein
MLSPMENDLQPEIERALARQGELREVVRRHFGTTDKAVVRAVARFAEDDPSKLDYAALQLVAAAAPFLDGNRIATLINELPSDGLDLRTQPVDAAAARSAISKAFGAASGPKDGTYDLDHRMRLLRSLLVEEYGMFYSALHSAEQFRAPHRPHEAERLERIIRNGSFVQLRATSGHPLLDRRLAQLAVDRLSQDLLPGSPTRDGKIDPVHHEYLDAAFKARALDGEGLEATIEALSTMSAHGRQLVAAQTTDTAVLRHIADMPDLDSEARESVLRNSKTPIDVLRRDVHKGRGADNAITFHDAAPPDLLVEIAASTTNMQTLRRAIFHDNMPADAIRDLLRSEQPEKRAKEIVEAAGYAPNTPRDILEAFAASPDRESRQDVACNKNAGDLLTRLAADPDDDVRWAVAMNTSTPDTLLRTLAVDSSPSVRSAIVQYDKTVPVPTDVLQLLSEDPSAEVRGSLARFAAKNHVALEPEFWRRTLPEMDDEPRTFVSAILQEEHPDLVDVQHPLQRMLEETERAIDDGFALPSARRLKDWRQLPCDIDRLIPDPSAIRSAIECIPLAQRQGSVARTGREIYDLGDSMGNCLKTFVERAQAGSVVVASYPDPDRKETYAVVWDVDDGSLHFNQCGAKQNEPNLPDGFEDDARNLATDFNLGLKLSRSLDTEPVSRRRPGIRRVGRQAPHAGLRVDPQRGVHPDAAAGPEVRPRAAPEEPRAQRPATEIPGL